MIDWTFIASVARNMQIPSTITPGKVDRTDIAIGRGFCKATGRSVRADTASLMTASIRRCSDEHIQIIRVKSEEMSISPEEFILSSIDSRWYHLPGNYIHDTNPYSLNLDGLPETVTPGEFARRDVCIVKAVAKAQSCSIRDLASSLLDTAFKRNRAARVAVIEFEAGLLGITFKEYVERCLKN